MDDLGVAGTAEGVTRGETAGAGVMGAGLEANGVELAGAGLPDGLAGEAGEGCVEGLIP